MNCEICGKPLQRNKRFCSRKCYGEWFSKAFSGQDSPHWTSILHTCQFCGKGFWVEAGRSAKGGGKYCSRACYGESKRTRPKKERKPPRQRKRYKVSCTGCGKIMDLPEWEFRAGRKFCSPKCYGKWRSKNLRGERNASWKGGKVERVCEWCGCTFKFAASPSRTGRGRFCSKDCWYKWRSANLTGENSTNWKGGPITLICERCGKKFTKTRSLKDKARFCSRNCAYKNLHEQTKKAWAEGKYDFLKYTICNPSKLELGFAATLDKYGIVHKQQYQIQCDGRFFDFYIPEHNLLIEVDGEFWHHSDWAKKQGRPAKDRAKSTFATQQGYNLWRVRESEITEVGSPRLLKQIGLINAV